MLRLFADNLLPVFLAAGAGYLLAWRSLVDVRSLSRVAFLVLAPCLIFRMIVENELPDGDLLRMIAFALATLAVPAAVAWSIARVAGWPRPLTAAVVLVVLLPNAGNLGLSVNLFAFGEEGVAQAGIYFVTSSIVTFTLAVFVASLGRVGFAEAARGLVRVPTIWAVVAALVLTRSGASLPSPVGRTVEMLSHACIPIFLVVLGMRLRENCFRGPYGALATAVGLRMLGGAAVGLIAWAVVGLDGVARQAGVLQSAMPSAVICTVLATEYDTEPDFVTGAVVVTTLLSPLTLTPLLAHLVGSG